MSSDETFLIELFEALKQEGLETVVIENAAAALHGVPVMTQDIDLMVRDHPHLMKKLKKFASLFGVTLSASDEQVTTVIRAVGQPVLIDFVRAVSSRQRFESIRSRATKIKIGRRMVYIAALDDIIADKEAAKRPKDIAVLPILKDALTIKKEMEKKSPSDREIISSDAAD